MTIQEAIYGMETVVERKIQALPKRIRLWTSNMAQKTIFPKTWLLRDFAETEGDFVLSNKTGFIQTDASPLYRIEVGEKDKSAKKIRLCNPRQFGFSSGKSDFFLASCDDVVKLCEKYEKS